jgi:hypothetical protein
VKEAGDLMKDEDVELTLGRQAVFTAPSRVPKNHAI